MWYDASTKNVLRTKLMTIQIKIRELAQSRGLKNAYQLRKATKLAPSTATRCFNNKLTLITLDTLEKLCDGLDCEPNELFAFIKDKKLSDVK